MKKFLYTYKTKECYKVKNLIKNTPSKLHDIHQRRGTLRTSEISANIVKNFQLLTIFAKNSILAGFLIHVKKE